MLLWTSEFTYLFKLVFLFSLDIYPGVKLLDYRIVLFSVFWETSMMFPIMPAPIYILTVLKCSLFSTFLPTFTVSVLFFYNRHPNQDEVIIVVLIYISMLISDVEHFFIYLLAICMFLGKTSIQFLSPYFNCVICSFDIVCMISLYTLNINLFSDRWFANIFSHSIGYLFILLTVSFGCRGFLNVVSPVYFCFCCLRFYCHIQGIIQFSPVARLYPNLCNPMDHSTSGLPVHHQLPEFTQTHVHWVGDAI